MKTKVKRNTLLVIGMFLIVTIEAQDDINKQQFIYPGGLFIEYGFGKYAVKDEYISDQKYTGNLPYFSLNWSRFNDGHGYMLGIESRSSTELFNNNVVCKLTQNILKQDYFYSFGSFDLFKNKVHTYLGPSVNILLYTLNYDFGTYNHVTTESNGTIVSLGFNTQFISKVTEKISAESALHMSLVSIGSKAFQSYKYDEPESKLLLVPKALNTVIDVGFRYYIFSSLSAKVAYKLQIYQINEWDPMIACSNNLIFSVTYHFKKGGN
jgi:hypothetical protein